MAAFIKQIVKSVIIIGIIITLICGLILGFIYYPTFVTERKVKKQEATYEKISYTEMTSEQRMEDVDYIFEMAETSLPYVYDMGDVYGYSFLDKKEYYRSLAADCKDDYDFFIIMSEIINDIPSGHAYVISPDFTNCFSSGYYRSDTVGITLTDNLQGKYDAYAEYLVGKQKEYDAENENTPFGFCSFLYYDGKYLCDDESIEGDLKYSVIESINGGEPNAFVVNSPSFDYQVRYDSKFSAPIRGGIIFTDHGTEPVDVKLKLFDGTETTVQLYYDDHENFVRNMGPALFNDEFLASLSDEETEVFEANPDADEDSFSITTDEEKSIAYFYMPSFGYSSGDKITEELRQYADYDTIVIDLRGNGGGSPMIFKNYIYHALYKDDDYYEATGYIPKNKYTDGLFGGTVDKIVKSFINDIEFEDAEELPEGMYDCTDGQYYKYTTKYELTGDSRLSYSDDRKVYYICNFSTCSAADEVMQIVKQCGLGTVIGTNTMGEGRIFGVCTDWLPNSLLTYLFCPQYAIDTEGNSTHLHGTVPDEFTGINVDGFIITDMLEEEGKDWSSLESREKWDSNYIYILNELGYDIPMPDAHAYLSEQSDDIAA